MTFIYIHDNLVCVFIHAKFIQVFRLGYILVPGSRAIAGMKAQEAAARSEKSEKSNPADSCEAICTARCIVTGIRSDGIVCENRILITI